LIPAAQKVTREDLLATFPDAKRIVAVDFYVQGAETWEAIAGGWQCEFEGVTFLNIDHHAPHESMMRFVSSGVLATDYVCTHGILKGSDKCAIVINHCDCDSTVASAIVTGFVNPEWRFKEAVIAADHTGEPNDIADALQALESKRNLELSLATLDAFRYYQELSAEAREVLQARHEERASLAQFLEDNQGRIHEFGPVVVVEAEERIAGEMLTALLPDAVVVVCTSPRGSDKFNVKARLGAAAPSGKTLFNLGLYEFDSAFGGRWNAGSNKRGENGGTALTPQEYGRQLAELVNAKLK
jgi:hypothetical protein